MHAPLKHWFALAAVLAIGQPLFARDVAPAPWELGTIDPPWADAQPKAKIRVEYNAGKSAEENGAALDRTIQGLKAGQMLLLGPGRYSIARKFTVDLRGTAKAPIWIVGADPKRPPVITRPDARQNVMNVGERSRTEYVYFRGLEFTGGSTLIRFYDCHHIGLDRCHLHHAGAEGITTNTRDTSHFYVTRNHFHDFKNPRATGEAMYLGANHGKSVMSYSVIAQNHVNDCGGTQGDGIELKQGSHHNWIVDNHVHDTNYPCILLYGTGGKGINVVERNICYRSGDNTLQVQGEAIVRNNLLMTAGGSALASTDHQGKSTNLRIVHNTLISARRGANLTSWNDREGMVFANNVVYTKGGDAVRFSRGSKGVTMAGNVVSGKVSGTRLQMAIGNGLSDLRDVSWDAKRHDASLPPKSALTGVGEPRFAVELDLTGKKRGPKCTPGAYDGPR